MESLYPNKSVVVKDNGDEALALRLTDGDYFHFKGEVAKLVVILFRGAGAVREAICFEKVRKTLARESKAFAKNKKQKQCIEEAITYLKERGLLLEKADL